MRLSQMLYFRAEDLWREAAEKPFVTEMAKGTLDRSRFRSYLQQDHLYLLGYIDLLKAMLQASEKPSCRDFLLDTIRETKQEISRVHLPDTEKAGSTKEQLRNGTLLPIASEYLRYMRDRLDGEGLIAGLTALLQCSWCYAFIGQSVSGKYGEELSGSPYKSWFDAYTCPEYTEANRRWIELVDKEAEGISSGLSEELGLIFRTCAEYENRLWDAF